MKAIAVPGLADSTIKRRHQSCRRGSFPALGMKWVTFAPGLAPPLRQSFHAGFEALARRLAPRPVLRLFLLDLCPDEQQSLRAFGIRRREENRQWAPLGHADQSGALGADRVHDGTNVVHPLLERADRNVVGEAHSALVEHDQPRERGEAVVEAPDAGLFAKHLQVREGAVDEDDVERALANGVVGDVDVTASRVTDLRFGRAHRARLQFAAHTGATWFRRGRFSGRVASRGPRSAS
jgi:hypothetical protein